VIQALAFLLLLNSAFTSSSLPSSSACGINGLYEEIDTRVGGGGTTSRNLPYYTQMVDKSRGGRGRLGGLCCLMVNLLGPVGFLLILTYYISEVLIPYCYQ